MKSSSVISSNTLELELLAITGNVITKKEWIYEKFLVISSNTSELELLVINSFYWS